MDIAIRYYQEKDLEEVNIILNEAFNITKSNIEDNNFQELVATSNNKVVGYLLLTKVYNPIKKIFYFIVDYVCVLSTYRGKGIGKKLLNYIDEIAKKDHISYIELTSNYNRVSAHKLYEHSGYIKRESHIFRKSISN